MEWIRVCATSEVLGNGGSCVKVEGEQVAVFNFDNGQEWYAVQNLCPHKREQVLARGLTGDDAGEPKVACPLHKNAFSLKTGKHLGGNDAWQLKTYPVKVKNNEIYIQI